MPDLAETTSELPQHPLGEAASTSRTIFSALVKRLRAHRVAASRSLCRPEKRTGVAAR